MTELGATPPGTPLDSPTELEDTGNQERETQKSSIQKGDNEQTVPEAASDTSTAPPILIGLWLSSARPFAGCWAGYKGRSDSMRSKDLQSSTGAHSPQHILSVKSLQSPAVHSFLKPDVH